MKTERAFLKAHSSMAIREEREYGMLASSFVNWEQCNLYNTVISGGRMADRGYVELSLMRMARQAGGGRDPMPVFAIYQNNPVLEDNLNSIRGNVRLPGHCWGRLEPFAGMHDSEIADRLYSAAGKIDGSATTKLRELFLIGCDLLRLKNIRPGIKELGALEWRNLHEEINRLVSDKAIDSREAMRLLAKLDELKNELMQADYFMYRLLKDYGGAIPADTEPVSFEDVLERNAIAGISLSAGMECLRELYFLCLIELMRRGKKFLLVIDSLAIPQEGSYMRQLLNEKSSSCAVVLSYDDVPALLRKDFESFVPSGTNILLFSHQSGASAEVWANYLGKSYEMIESETYTESRERFSVFDKQISRGRSRQQELRHKIPTSDIQEMPAGVALVQPGTPASDCWYVDYPVLYKLQNEKRLFLTGRR